MPAPNLEARTSVQEFLAELVRGKTVLDVGCVDDSLASETTDTWLHKHLARTAGSITGVDILAAEAEALCRRGYNVSYGDATSICLGREFDMIIAGELIEHISNPGALLANLGRHLKSDGLLVLTTPHVFFLQHYIEFLVGIQNKRWHPQHVAWYCPFTLESLLRQNGYEVESCYLFTRSRKIRAMMRILHLRFKFLGSTIVMIARRAR